MDTHELLKCCYTEAHIPGGVLTGWRLLVGPYLWGATQQKPEGSPQKEADVNALFNTPLPDSQKKGTVVAAFAELCPSAQATSRRLIF